MLKVYGHSTQWVYLYMPMSEKEAVRNYFLKQWVMA
jgi:hypothetical protein